MRPRLFWHIWLAYIGLILAVLVFTDIASTHALRRQALRAAEDRMATAVRLAQANPAPLNSPAQAARWLSRIADSHLTALLFDSRGALLAKSSSDLVYPEDTPASSDFQQALANGASATVESNPLTITRFVRIDRPGAAPVVARVSLSLSAAGSEIAELQRQLFLTTFCALAIGSIALYFFYRIVVRRLERLTTFSRRLAQGDFHPLADEEDHDEFSGLTAALNETALGMERTVRWLTGERNRASTILRSMVEGVTVIDAQERIVFSNGAFCEILNVTSERVEGRPLIEVVRNTTLVETIRRALRGEEGLRSDIAMGFVQQRSFTITAAPVKALHSGTSAAEEKPSGAVVVLHEVTELRRLERVRQDFVANVSHEFKTPLTAIQGFAETLLAGAIDDPDNNRRFLEIIRDHATRLARLTNDLLKLARIEAGKLELEFVPVRPVELIERCAETTLLKASWKQIALEIEVPPDLPAMRGDPALLQDVLQNLLDNAIQYTGAGGRITVSATASAGDATISVTDSGIGIPLAEQERIFERFYRVDAARSREAGGTGLGLSIAKHIIEAHGGHLRLQSEVGHGSSFSFSVPLIES